MGYAPLAAFASAKNGSYAAKIRKPGFMLFGLPRSRTAWMANFLTSGGMFCHHDGLSLCRDDADIRKMFDGPARFTGNSDTGQVIFYDRIAPMFLTPPKLVFIRRDPKECAESCRKAGLPIVLSDLQFLAREMDRLAAEHHEQSIVHDFDALDEAACEMIWTHCCRGELPFDSARFRMLSDLNVQMHPAIMAIELSRRADNIRALLA